jgi:hypothetical protein
MNNCNVKSNPELRWQCEGRPLLCSEIPANHCSAAEGLRVDERPSFRRRRDVLRLVAAVLAPWLLLAIAFAPALVFRELYRAGWESESAGNAVSIWFYSLGIAALFAGVGLFFLGVGRLVWYRPYRQSVYGWAWPLLMWFSIGVLSLATGH